MHFLEEDKEGRALNEDKLVSSFPEVSKTSVLWSRNPKNPSQAEQEEMHIVSHKIIRESRGGAGAYQGLIRSQWEGKATAETV